MEPWYKVATPRSEAGVNSLGSATVLKIKQA